MYTRFFLDYNRVMSEQNIPQQKENKSVLIIDDDASIIKMYTIAFKQRDILVLYAYEGKEGISIAKKKQPALILLDVLMLGESGLNVLKALKRDKDTAYIPVIIFTNIQPEEDVTNAFKKAGAKEYLVKSQYTPQEIVDFCCKEILREKGFTLIESLLYVAIVGGIVTSVALFGLAISDARSKNYAAQEVQANGRTALQIMASRIRESTNATVFNPQTLILEMRDLSKNPTVINLDGGGSIQLQEGTMPVVSLVSDEVKVTNLVFADATLGGIDRKNIQVNITVKYDAPGSSVPFAYSTNFRTAVSERQ